MSRILRFPPRPTRAAILQRRVADNLEQLSEAVDELVAIGAIAPSASSAIDCVRLLIRDPSREFRGHVLQPGQWGQS